MEAVTLTSAVLGALVGSILALTGAGGGILAVPSLLFVLHLGVAEAGPIALMAVGVSAAVGAAIGLRAGVVRYRAAAVMGCAGIVFSPVGLWLAHRVPKVPLTVLFAIVLAYVSIRMFRQAGQPAAAVVAGAAQPCQLETGRGRFIWTAACTRAISLSGICAGFLSGLLGVGGGFVVVPALRRATNAPMHAIVPTSLAVIAIVSSGGVLTAALTGHMNWAVGIPFTGGAIAGMACGYLVAGRINGPRMQRAFALVAGLVAVGMIAKVALPALTQ